MSCTVPEARMDVLRERLGMRAFAERIPLTATVEIIATCNFACKHCYIAPCAEREDVMSLEQAQVLFDKLAAAGTLSVLLTGGEIFTHRQFREIYLAAKRHGFMIYLNTNAYLIGERWANFLAEWPPEYVSISLYGLSDERYEAVTGIPNSFRRVTRAIDLLVERGVRTELKCPAMSLTADELPAMKAFAEARGLSFRYDPIMTPDDRGRSAPIQLQLAPRRVVDLDEQMDPGLRDMRAFADEIGVAPRRNNNVYQCGAGRTALSVNVKGGVSTCVSSRQTVGNLLEQPFDEVWGMLGGKVAKTFEDGHPCATCKFRGICAGCPATVEQVTGLPDGYVQQYCKITHLRAQRMGFHETGVPRTVTEGIPSHVRVPLAQHARALPVLA
ncbi:MAG TPA: radical SAM protein [Gemmatimonadaceae bacterium]|nr:radical SAM protein [Gemmatimonadaceae bacterium]